MTIHESELRYGRTAAARIGGMQQQGADSGSNEEKLYLVTHEDETRMLDIAMGKRS